MIQKQSTTLSLILSTLNEGEELLETVRSVFAGSVVPAETIIVDDGGTDDSCQALERLDGCAGLRVHRIERSGIAAARNAGGKLASGAYLAFLDAHCRVDADCLGRLDSSLTAHPDAILVPAISDFGSTVYGCGARLIDAELRVRWVSPGRDNAVLSLVPIAPGGCLAVSRAIFDHLNGFGAFRELGLEDVDFSLRAWRAGIDVLALPSARLAHRFRPYPPYRLASSSRAYNVARVALINFDSSRREECLRTIIGTPRAAEVLVDAFMSDWEDCRNYLAATSSRTIEALFEKFGDWR